MATLINFSQLAKYWKIAAGAGIVLVGVGGTVVTLSTMNSSNQVTMKEYSDGSRTQSGNLLVKSGSLAVNIQNNGNLNVQGVLSGNKLYVGTMSGAGLNDCDSDNQTLGWDSTTQRFVCGDDDTGSGSGGSTNTGALQNVFDSRYVKKSGDTMTGSLNLTGSSLYIYGTGSARADVTNFGQFWVKNDSTTTPMFTGGADGLDRRIRTLYQVHARSNVNPAILDSTYLVNTEANDPITVTLPNSTAENDGHVVSIIHTNETGTVIVTTNGGTQLVGGATTQVIVNHEAGFTAESDGDDGEWHIVQDSRPKVPTTSLTFYGLTEAAPVGGYNGLALSVSDSRYSSTATDQALSAITGSDQLLGTWATNTGALQTLLQSETMSFIFNIRKDSGAANAYFYAKVYHRNAAGTETLIGTSGISATVSSSVYEENDIAALTSSQNFTSTDYLVIKFYGTKVGGGSNPSYSVQLEGTTNSDPARAIIAVSSATANAGLVLTDGSRPVTGNMNFLATLSGARLHAEKNLTSSGSLVFEGSASGASLYIATSINGAGLTDCDAATQTLNWDATTGRFSCGTDSDTTYTFSQGLTTNGTNVSLSANISGSTLEFPTLSGSSISFVNPKDGNSSTLITHQASLNRFTFSNENAESVFILTGNDGTSTTLSMSDASADALFDIIGDSNSHDLTFDGFGGVGNVFKVISTATTNDSAFFYNGDYMVNFLGSPSDFQNIFNAVGGQSSDLMQLKSLVTGDVASISGSGGAVFNISNLDDADFQIKSNGSNNMFFLNSATNRIGINTGSPKTTLDVLGVMSGSNLTISRSASVSGTLLVKTSITSKGSVSGSTIDGFGLGDCSNASTSKLLYNNTTDKFVCGTDQTSTLVAGQGLTINGTSIRLNATVTGSTLSGTHIVASRSLTVSGATLIKGNLTSKGTISGAMLNIMAGASPSYIMGALALGKTTVNTNVKLDVVGRISGSTLSISSASSFSGAVLMKRNLTVNQTISGSRLVVSGHTNISGSLLVKKSASAASIFGKRCPVPMSVELSLSGSALTTGSGKLTMLVPRYLSGYSLAHFSATVDQAGTTGLTRIGVRNVDKGKRSLFSTLPSIDSAETKTATAATPYVINAATDDVSGDDRLTFDILQIQTTAPKGMDITMEFSCP